MAKKATKSKASPTLVTFLLDRSGSMGSCLESTIEAFNGYLDGLRDTPDLDFSLVLFDHHNGAMDLTKVCVASPIKTVAKLSRETYVPRGSTPLIDAAYTVIEAVETSLESKPKDTKVVVCIQTDGQENCSRQHNWEELNSLIKSKQDKGWQFNFMGAGIDAYQQARRMGVSGQSTMSYDHTNLQATRAAFAANAANTASFSAGLSASTAYSDLQKQAAGDKFDPSMGIKIGSGGYSNPPTVKITSFTGAKVPFDLSIKDDPKPAKKFSL